MVVACATLAPHTSAAAHKIAGLDARRRAWALRTWVVSNMRELLSLVYSRDRVGARISKRPTDNRSRALSCAARGPEVRSLDHRRQRGARVRANANSRTTRHACVPASRLVRK